MKLLIIPLAAAVALASCAAPEAPAAEAAVPGKKVARTAAAKPKPAPYPLEKCLVTGDGLDEFDERVSLVHDGQTYEFCCKPCVKKFRANPGKYARALAKARR